MKVLLLRHGETDDNTKHVIQGQKPGFLNERGRAQASAAGTVLKNEAIDYVICSDLKRAVESFEAALPNYEGSLVQDERLRERHFGVLQGQHRDAYIEDKKKKGDDEFTYKPEGGESHLQVYERMKHFWNELITNKPGQCVLLVSHGGVIRHLLALAAGDAVEAIESHAIVVNSSICEFKVHENGKVETIKIGCAEHLKSANLDGIKMEPI